MCQTESSTCLGLFNLLTMNPPWVFFGLSQNLSIRNLRDNAPNLLLFCVIVLCYCFVSCLPDLDSTRGHYCLIFGRSCNNIHSTKRWSSLLPALGLWVIYFKTQNKFLGLPCRFPSLLIGCNGGITVSNFDDNVTHLRRWVFCLSLKCLHCFPL